MKKRRRRSRRSRRRRRTLVPKKEERVRKSFLNGILGCSIFKAYKLTNCSPKEHFLVIPT
jgi:hypothetical protein